MTFRVGQKVVCVKANGCIGPMSPSMTPITELSEGGLYVVRWVGVYQPKYRGELWGDLYIGIRLVGIIRTDCPDTPFDATRFRPIVERKTDISVFTEILRKATKPARTPAMSQHQR